MPSIFEYVLIVILPLVVPLVLFVFGLADNNFTVFVTVFILQILIVIFLLSLYRRRSNRIKDNQNFSTEEQFISLYERSPTPYLITNKRGEIMMFNPAAVKLFETTVDSLAGLNFFDMLDFESDTDLAVTEVKMESGETIKEKEIKLHTVTGSIKWISLSMYRHDIKSQRLVSLVDVTKEKMIDTAKTEFVALATHQLRTPISAIRWNLELLQKKMQETKTEEQSRYLVKIERNILRMIALIDDFLNVSKLEMGTFATKYEVLSLTELLDSITEEYAEKISEKGISLHRADNPENLSLRTDVRLLHIIISNLMSNAVKYSNNDGDIDLSYKLSDSNIAIVVADNGIGVPAGEINKLFSKFYRASNAQSFHTEGTGLGLYIVKQSVEKLGGTINVSSDDGEKTVFSVTLPYLK